MLNYVLLSIAVLMVAGAGATALWFRRPVGGHRAARRSAAGVPAAPLVGPPAPMATTQPARPRHNGDHATTVGTIAPVAAR